MELRHLRNFLAIAAEENFRRAATRLHVSQSPLSRQMQQLEDELGADLFEPSGRGVRLTAAGALFVERAKAILASVDAAAEEARAAAPAPRRPRRRGPPRRRVASPEVAEDRASNLGAT